MSKMVSIIHGETSFFLHVHDGVPFFTFPDLFTTIFQEHTKSRTGQLFQWSVHRFTRSELINSIGAQRGSFFLFSRPPALFFGVSYWHMLRMERASTCNGYQALALDGIRLRFASAVWWHPGVVDTDLLIVMYACFIYLRITCVSYK